MHNASTVEKIATALARLAENDEFSGAVQISHMHSPMFQHAYGLANKSYHVSNRVDTKFNIASVGKMLTGVAVLQLVERGLVALDAPLSTYLSDDWVKPEYGDKIQIQHLLTHTSGYGTYFGKLYTQMEQPFFRDLGDYQCILADEKPAFEPGSQWAYSNTGMHLLGVVMETVTEQSYHAYMQENLYDRAGMVNTGAYDIDIPLDNRATGYRQVDGAWHNVPFRRILKGGPSGGSLSTVEDLSQFSIALQSHQLLNAHYTDLALTAKPELNSPFYGYGFFVENGDFGRMAHHAGDGMDASSQFRMYIDLGYTIVVLSNYGRPAAQCTMDAICEIIIE